MSERARRRRVTAALVATLAASGSAWAQTPFGGALAPRVVPQARDREAHPEPRTETGPSPTTTTATDDDGADPSRGARIAVGSVTGLAGGATLGFGLAVLMSQVSRPLSSSSEAILTIGGGALGWTLGVSGGISLIGYAMGGHGNFGWTSLGVLAGSLPGLGVMALGGEKRVFLGVWTGVLLGVAGGVLGYELSSASGRRRAAPRALPDVAVSSQGVTVGLTGAF